MIAEPWTTEELLAAYGASMDVWVSEGRGRRWIASEVTRDSGRVCGERTARSVLDHLRLIGGAPRPATGTGVVDVDPPRDGELPIEELLRRRVETFDRQIKKADVHQRSFELPAEPFAILAMGDPHVDNNGCNFAALIRDVQMCQAADAVYGINVGDLQDNWIGRLQRLYADAECTASEGWRLSAWLLEQLDWLAVVGGNHDAWAHGPGTDPLGWVSREARVRAYASDEVHLTLSWRGRAEWEPLKIMVRHDFAGRSWYNAMHGPHKEAMLDSEIHLALCGHTHQWGELTTEQRHGRCTHALRLRGYKHEDSHARRLGFYQQQFGSSALLVVDPSVEGPGRIARFWDVRRGIDYLGYLRGK